MKPSAPPIAKHGVGFTAIMDFEWETGLVWPDTRDDYGELREVALGFIGTRLHSVVFTERDGVVRIISCARRRGKRRSSMPKISSERVRARSRARAALRAISAKEDAAVRKAANSDPENPEWTAKDFRRAQRLTEAMPEFVEAVRGRPRLERPKVQVTLRLDAEVIESFRAEGRGWQSHINDLLSRAAKRRKGIS